MTGTLTNLPPEMDANGILAMCRQGLIPANAGVDAAIGAHRLAFELFVKTKDESDQLLAANAIRAVIYSATKSREEAQQQCDYLAALPMLAWEGVVTGDPEAIREATLANCARGIAWMTTENTNFHRETRFPSLGAPSSKFPTPSSEGVSIVNRRSVMSALSSAAALPFLTITSPSIAAASVPTSDQEILRIAAEIFGLRPQYLAASEAIYHTNDEYRRRRPEYPDDLLWGPLCPVRYTHFEVKRDGKTYLLSNFDDVRKLPGRKHVRYYLYIGEPGAEPHDAFDDMGDVLPEYAHLYEAPVDEQQHAIADRMVKALNDWEREYYELRKELRYDEVMEEYDVISGQICDLVERMESLRAHTLPALRAKAAVLAQHLMACGDESQVDESNGLRLIESLIHDLGGTLPVQGGSVRNFANCGVRP